MINDSFEKCNLCPRNCNVQRYNNKGYCLTTNEIKVARASLHFWEEPCISGESGSGTVFFAGCNLRCVFCQNHSIATASAGKIITVERLAQIFLELQEKGALNINLVTPNHYVPQIISAISISRKNGLTLPIVYNTNSYEKPETLKLLERYVDIYLPDFKYMDSKLSKKYSNAEDYQKVAKKALAEMVRQVGKPVFDDNGIMKKGVIVRHLMLPSHIDDSKKIIKYLYETYSDDVILSIMNQYTPLNNLQMYPELNRKITDEEYDILIDYAIALGVKNAFIQEGNTADESFIPAFDNEGV